MEPLPILFEIAWKSFLVAGATLLVLRFAKDRTAGERSWIAHAGLAVLLALPAAALLLPAWSPRPATIDATGTAAERIAIPDALSLANPLPEKAAPPEAVPPAALALPSPETVALWLYLVPLALLAGTMLVAVLRLATLRGRAQLIEDAPWLTALARAQRRMGFKHGTALLTSDELPSPISWGVIRPVILLNSEAAESHHEAEAIIAHELAHVANLDWAKLLLARVATAIFWFNPLVWLLAREAHQLREEAADDAVLGADIEDTEYARLLVGVARHQCRGMLIGAHGVAPSRNSLSRRVRRVLDGALARAPGGWRWSTAAAFFAAGMAVPVAALNVVPSETASASAGEFAANQSDPATPYYAASADDAPVISNAIRNAVSTSVAGALSVVHPHPDLDRDLEIEIEKTIDKAMDDAWRGPGPKPGSVGPRPGSVGPRGPVGPQANAIERAIAIKTFGVTPEYIAAMRAASPRLRSIRADDAVGLRAVGVTPAYVQALAAAGYGHLDADELMEARALNVDGNYIRGLAAAGYPRLGLDQLVDLRAMGVTGADIERFRRAGYTRLTVDQLVEMKAMGVKPEDLRDAERDDGS